MDVHIVTTEKNRGRSNAKGEKRIIDFRGILQWISDGHLQFQSHDGNERFFIPTWWILSIDDQNEDQSLLHHVDRDVDEFYIFNFFRTVITFFDAEARNEFAARIQGRLASFNGIRPKKLFVILNPKAGWGKSVEIFNDVALPLFSIAGVQLDVVVVEPGEDICAILAAKDFSGIDGVFTAGGDGTHSAIFNGLLQKHKVSLDKENPMMPDLYIPVGILPVGSGNGTSFINNMSHDLQSCVVNVILGYKRSIDLLSIHDMNRDFKCLKVGHLMVQIQSVNAVVQYLEKLRFLGPFRYLAIIFLLLSAKDPIFNISKYKRVDNDPHSLCAAEEVMGKLIGCSHCEPVFLSKNESVDDGQTQWFDLKRGDGVRKGAVNLELIRWALPIKGIDVSWSCTRLHTGNGSGKLVLVDSLGVLGFLKFFWCWYADWSTSRFLNPPQCAWDVVSQAKISVDSPVPVAVDGEVLEGDLKEIYIKVHKRAALVYGTGTISGHPKVSTFNSILKVRMMAAGFTAFLLVLVVLVGYGSWCLLTFFL